MKTRAAVGIAIIGSLVLLALFVRDHAYSLYDDAYIYLRYVKNVRAGCGLRFNCSEPPIEGFSGPLYLAILVLGSLVTTKLVTLTQVVGTIGLGGALVTAVVTVARSETAPTRRAAGAIAVAAILGLDHYVLLNAVIGLESAVAALAIALLLAALAEDRRRLAVVLAFAVALLRPEGVLFVLFLPVLPWARSRRVLAVCAGGLAAIVAARWAVFHDVAPNTYWAKSGGTPRHLELGIRYVLGALRDFPAVVAAPLALLGARGRDRAAYFLGASAAWLAVLVKAGGDTFEYSRLVFPLVPALTVLGVQGAMAAIGRRDRASLATAIASVAIAGRAAVAHDLPKSHGFANVTTWTAIGKHLKAHYPGKVIATVPIGAIGYFSQLEIIDLVGLTSREIAKAGRSVPPEMLDRNWIGHERHDLEYVLARAPDLIVFATKTRETPWTNLDEASAGFYADWLLLRAAKSGAPYRVEDLALAENFHVFALARVP